MRKEKELIKKIENKLEKLVKIAGKYEKLTGKALPISEAEEKLIEGTQGKNVQELKEQYEGIKRLVESSEWRLAYANQPEALRRIHQEADAKLKHEGDLQSPIPRRGMR